MKDVVETLEMNSLFERSTVMSDVVAPEIPFVLHLLLADLALKLFPDGVHIQNMLEWMN